MTKPPKRPGRVLVTDPKTAQRITLRLAVEGEGFAGRLKQQFRSWVAAGLSDEEILKKFEKETSPGGTIFDGLMRSFGTAAGEAVDYVTIEQAHENWTGDNNWIWITVTDENRCDDCKERHGQMKTWEEWEALGLPGAGATVCGWRCRCTLEPREYAEGISLDDILSGT